MVKPYLSVMHIHGPQGWRYFYKDYADYIEHVAEDEYPPYTARPVIAFYHEQEWVPCEPIYAVYLLEPLVATAANIQSQEDFMQLIAVLHSRMLIRAQEFGVRATYYIMNTRQSVDHVLLYDYYRLPVYYDPAEEYQIGIQYNEGDIAGLTAAIIDIPEQFVVEESYASG